MERAELLAHLGQLVANWAAAAISAAAVAGWKWFGSSRFPNWARFTVSGMAYLGWVGLTVIVWNPVIFVASAVLWSAMVMAYLLKFYRIGIVEAHPRLDRGIDFKRSLALAQDSMDFLGVGASKLIRNEQAFIDAMVRCHSVRPVRLLLADPTQQELLNSAKRAGEGPGVYQERVRRSIAFLERLKRERSLNIHIRLYRDHLPDFRILLLNDSLCIVSPYAFGKDEGLGLPQLHLAPSAGRSSSTSFFQGFRNYFERLWLESADWRSTEDA